MKKLNQIVAIERDVKKTAYSELSKNHVLMQKGSSVTGETKVYEPTSEDGVRLPPESRLLQTRVEDELVAVKERQAPYFDLVLTKDTGNQHAGAELTLPNGVVLGKLPVPTLLFLEKQLHDMHTFVAKLPVLDPEQAWRFDEAKQAYVTDPIKTVKTAKVQKPLVLVPATKEHPAQSQMITVDEIVGEWTTTRISGGITEGRRRTLMARVEAALHAVKQAREAANLAEVTELKMGEALFGYLFAQ